MSEESELNLLNKLHPPLLETLNQDPFKLLTTPPNLPENLKMFNNLSSDNLNKSKTEKIDLVSICCYYEKKTNYYF